MIEKIKEWAGQNKMVALAIAAVAALFIIKKMSKRPRRRRRVRSITSAGYRRRRTAAPRRRSYTKGGKAKKPWQIKGSLAAKRRMAQIRKRRAA